MAASTAALLAALSGWKWNARGEAESRGARRHPIRDSIFASSMGEEKWNETHDDEFPWISVTLWSIISSHGK